MMERKKTFSTEKRLGNFTLYWRYVQMHLKSGLQYKGWTLMVLQTFVAVITDPISTILMFHRFGSIGEWSIERILLLYAMAIASFGLAESFCRGFDYFPWHMVRTGNFDRLLLRPRSLFLQTAVSFFHIHRLARVVSGLAAMGWCLWRMRVVMTPFRLLLLVMALMGGFLLYAGVFVLTSGIAFFTVKALDWIYIFTNAGYQVTRCPIEYMPQILRATFTFVIPILVISYYPASVICGWGEPLWKGLLALPAGLLFLLAGVVMWRVGIYHYKSTGN